VEGAQRRDFVEVVWQIAERRGCDEVVIRYDCGHAIRADVWAPALPKTREYGCHEAERRRFMQHTIFVLTKDPGAPKVQVTIPEGRCRHCGRGQRQVLICGPLQMDLGEDRMRSRDGAKLAAAARRLELPLSSHTFLAAMGQVCKLPENITPPPLVQGGAGQPLRPFDGPPVPREAKHWSRKDIEDELKAEVVKYVGGATCVLLFVLAECLYLIIAHLGPGGNTSLIPTVAGELSNLSSVGAIELGIANSTWALSALTLSVHKAFGPSGGSQGAGGSSLMWSLLVHPLWVIVSLILAPVLWVLDLAVAVPRFIVLHVCLAVVRGLILRPLGWLLNVLSEGIGGSAVFLFRCVFTRPTAMLLQIPMTNPMAVAMVLSLLVAALSAPQPPGLSLPSVWGELPSLEISRGIRSLGPLMQRLRIFWASARREGRPKGGLRGAPTTRGQKEKAHADRSGRERTDAPGRPDRAQAGQKEGRAAAGSSQQSAPACFVCLDRPSRYVLEPCGHRVVCGDCAMQLVEVAARNRSASEAAGGGGHHSSERGGGCPSCGLAITRAMRLFS